MSKYECRIANDPKKIDGEWVSPFPQTEDNTTEDASGETVREALNNYLASCLVYDPYEIPFTKPDGFYIYNTEKETKLIISKEKWDIAIYKLEKEQGVKVTEDRNPYNN